MRKSIAATLLTAVGWIWMIVVWIASCGFSASGEAYGWLVLWILLPPVAWAWSVLMTIIVMIFEAPYPREVGAILFFFYTGWIWVFVMADKLKRRAA